MNKNVTLSKIRARLSDYLMNEEKSALIAFEKEIAGLKSKLKKEEDSCRFYQKMAIQLKNKFLEARDKLRRGSTRTKELKGKIKKLDWLWQDWAGKANKYKTELEKIKICAYDKYGMTAKDLEKAK